MARDGTNRGGRRVRAGTKPEPSAYPAVQQRDGTQLRADEIYRETWEWLADNGCCDRVPVCGHVAEFSEAGECVVVRDFRHRQSQLHPDRTHTETTSKSIKRWEAGNPPFGPLRAFANAAGARLCLLTPFLHLMQICIGCKIVSRETFCETTSLSGSVGH